MMLVGCGMLVLQKLEMKDTTKKLIKGNIKLRSPLQVGEKVFVLSSRLKKKDPAGQFYKSTTENRPFFDRNRISTIKNRTNINGINYYWITENNRTIKGRFLREELFALKNQFL